MGEQVIDLVCISIVVVHKLAKILKTICDLHLRDNLLLFAQIDSSYFYMYEEYRESKESTTV